MSECLIYYIKEGTTRYYIGLLFTGYFQCFPFSSCTVKLGLCCYMQINLFINRRVKKMVRFLSICQLLCFRVGLKDAAKNNDIQLSGSNIFEEHCLFHNSDGQSSFFALSSAKLTALNKTVGNFQISVIYNCSLVKFIYFNGCVIFMYIHVYIIFGSF